MPTNSRKLLIASIGIASVSYVAACSDDSTSTVDAGSDGSTFDAPTSGNLMSVDASTFDAPTSGNLMAVEAGAPIDAADAADDADGHD